MNIWDKMLTFKQFLKEEKLKHITHFEDNFLENGIKGFIENFEISKNIISNLQNTISSKNITIKFDGAPSVVFGINPENGKFFVGTKSVFNKTPLIAYTNSDIDEYYGHIKELANKLKICLKYLPEITKEGIYQGDLMFTDDKKNEKIDSINFLTFTPNTITYAVDPESTLGEKINKAKIGIIIHTQYTGKTIKNISANWNIDINKFSKSSNVWIDDAYIKDFSGTANFSPEETDASYELMNNASLILKKLNPKIFDELLDNMNIDILNAFINTEIRGGSLSTKGSIYFDNLINFLKKHYQIEADKLKTSKGKQTKEDIKQEIFTFLNKNRKQIESIFEIYLIFRNLKNLFLKKFEEIKSLGTFLRTPDGFIVTKPEGFCVLQTSGGILKIIDRLEFSKANFNTPKNWK